MSKLKNKKKRGFVKSQLSLEEKAYGKQQLYILIGMVVIGAVIGLYYMQ